MFHGIGASWDSSRDWVLARAGESLITEGRSRHSRGRRRRSDRLSTPFVAPCLPHLAYPWQAEPLRGPDNSNKPTAPEGGEQLRCEIFSGQMACAAPQGRVELGDEIHWACFPEKEQQALGDEIPWTCFPEKEQQAVGDEIPGGCYPEKEQHAFEDPGIFPRISSAWLREKEQIPEELGGEVPPACVREKEKEQRLFEPPARRDRPPVPDPQHHTARPPSLSRRILAAADLASLAAGGLATATILNFNRDPGECRHHNNLNSPTSLTPCPSFTSDQGWAVHVFEIIYPATHYRVWSTHIFALLVYGAVGMFQVALEHKYWADCGLVALFGALGAGGVYGVGCMLDALILGGFLSLLCARVVGWYVNHRSGQRAVARD